MGVVRRAVAVLDDEPDVIVDDVVDDVTKSEDPPDLYADDGLDPEDENETTGRSSAVLSGKAGQSKVKSMSSGYADEFKFVAQQKHLVRFLEDEPFASYRQHWVEKKGKKSYVCVGKGCPLCTAGDTPSAKFAYNVWSFDDQAVKALIMGPVMLEQLEGEIVASLKDNPLLESYWLLSRSGKGRKTTYGVTELKLRDLEDYGLTPASAALQYADAVLYKPSIISVPTLAELTKVAATFNEDDVDPEDD